MPESIMPSKSKESVKKYNKSYYDNNKAKILEKVAKKKKCEICDMECSKSNFNKHIKTDKHNLNVKIKELQNNNKIEFIIEDPVLSTQP